MHTPLIWVSLNLIAIWKEMAMNYTHILQFYMPDWSSLLSWKMISITSLLDSGRSNVRKSHCDFKLDCYLNHSLHERDLQWMEKFSSPCIPRQEENHLPSRPLSKPKVNCKIQFKVAQNSFQHFPRCRFWWVIITTLYQLMLQSWYQKTAQSLVNTLVLFSWHYRLP